MKVTRYVPLALFLLSACSLPAMAQFGGLIDAINGKVEEKVTQKATEKTGEAMDSMLGNKSKNQPSQSASTPQTQSGSPAAAQQSAQVLKAYNNYDFKSGENIIFEDHFADDQDGEFPAHWNLEGGQAVVNKVNGEPTFLMTDGNYVLVSPRMKTPSYLSDPFTMEFDYYQVNNNQWAPLVRFIDAEGTPREIFFGHEVHTGSFTRDLAGGQLGSDEEYYGKWHHAALIYQADQLKAYVDNTRALVVPHCDLTPVKFVIGGIGDANNPISIRNFRLASGGGANTIGKLLTDGKFVTHGITFEAGKATIKPESMGVLNDVAAFLKSHGSMKFEIDGHTDSDGSASSNMTLSQQRADAVKSQLVAMGIAGSRLTTTGFGASKPIAGNDTPEGKANNRRVEFVKQ
ncbi:MAG: OmpA family protein [Bacteroidota bacterium]|nr:OmpA family protein [Bacteroidota bacterium]MDP4231918.1 OmpA family protein [Bacteroidota bacterium]MDP4241375.1 OmpA family protein [Bacteroidota bacterium]MDP4287298.1 OmpA family protein [Bacteroidota bacterium]